jgi:hypothetical protein
MTAAVILIVVVALLCVALAAMIGILWATLHFGADKDKDD